MLDQKLYTLLSVAALGSFTGAAKELSLTQPAVSHHISALEEELGIRIFNRGKGSLTLTDEGEIAVSCARRMKVLNDRLRTDLRDKEHNLTRLRVGITHTAESNVITEVLARYGREAGDVVITVTTDTITNLYSKLEGYELDLAILEGKPPSGELSSLMLDTDYLVCVMSNENPLASHEMVTLKELRSQQMILRLPSSATRILFESRLESLGESLDSFDIMLEVDSVAAIKDLVRKDLGISILARSACMDELKKGKLTALPIENLSMIRETSIVYHRDFRHTHVLGQLLKIYRSVSGEK